jgi:hypothetical protein
VEELFELVRVGDEVDLIADPSPEEASLFEESHGNHLQAKASAADIRTVGGLQ